MVRITIVVSHINEMSLPDDSFAHLVGNSVIAVARPAIDTGPQQEMRTNFMRQAEVFVDVAFSIANMDAPIGAAQKLH